MNNYQLASIEEADLSHVFRELGTFCILLAMLLIEISIIAMGVSA
jgi:hypothetical protein